MSGIAVVTGAGGGLGQALAVELAGRGMDVAGIGRTKERLAETAAKIGDKFVPLGADVADPDQVESAFAELDAAGRTVELLINNAAVYPRFDFLTEDPRNLMRAIDINVGGMVYCSHAALKRMCETGKGRIMNVTTFADWAPISGASAYSVSKGAGKIFTKSLVADLGDRFPDIVVSDWVPGELATGMGVPHGINPEDSAKWGVDLALCRDRSLTGTLFDRNLEMMPPRSLKGKIKDLLLFRPRPKPRLTADLSAG